MDTCGKFHARNFDTKKFSYEGGFEALSAETGLPDDMLVGFIVAQLGIKMTEIETFHSHLENLAQLTELESQVIILIFY